MSRTRKIKKPDTLSGYFFVYEIQPDPRGYSVEVLIKYVKDPMNGAWLADVWIRSLDLRPEIQILAAYISVDGGNSREKTEEMLMKEVEESEEFRQALTRYFAMLTTLPIA